MALAEACVHVPLCEVISQLSSYPGLSTQGKVQIKVFPQSRKLEMGGGGGSGEQGEETPGSGRAKKRMLNPKVC